MFSTTFAAVALSAVLSTGATVAPTWQSDYSTAQTAAAAQQKPMAVFIGHGTTGYAKLVGGEIPAEAGQLLAKDYVCVYVDADTAAGQSLAGQFSLNSGLVISNRGGNLQALRHTGTVTPQALTGYLTRYSTVSTVTRTENGGVIPAGAVMGGCPNGRCGLSTGYYQPAPAFQGFPAFGGCANGQCPNVR